MDIVAKAIQEINSRYNENIEIFDLNEKIQRVGDKKRIWIIGREWTYKGENYASVTYGNWSEGDTKYKVNSFEDKKLSDKNFRKNYSKKMDLINEKLVLDAEEKNEDCKIKCTPIWEKSKKGELHEYLKEKGLSNAYVSRIDSNGALLIPAYDGSSFVGFQRIYRNHESNRFDKRFASGIKIKGSICPLTPFRKAGFVYVSESYSTSSSIQEVFPKIPVVCAFNAGNLTNAIATIRRVNPTCEVIICADRDENKVGEKAARKAAKYHPNTTFIVPKFKNDNGKWTDFNDMLQFNGKEEIKKQLKIDTDTFQKIVPLGVHEDKYYYSSTRNQQINKIVNFTDTDFKKLVPNDNWWRQRYPKKDPETEEIVGVNWSMAKDDLIDQCLNVGMFEPSKIRSSGCWKDNGSYIFHLGSNVLKKGALVSLSNNQLDNNYILGKKLPFVDTSNVLNYDERSALLELVGTISVASLTDGLFMMGWMVAAPICGALEWRPHIWLTGQSSEGKSWTMENIILKILGDYSIRPQGTSTEAGVRQAVGSSSVPIVFDEMETDDVKSRERVTAFVQYARQSSSAGDGNIYRGTAGGVAQIFNPNNAICAASIIPNLSHKQDKNRWTFINFDMTKQNPEQFAKAKEIIRDYVDTEGFGNKFVAYSFKHIEEYVYNFNKIENYLKVKAKIGHFCRQYASLISGYLLIVDPVKLSNERIEYFMSKLDLNFNEEEGVSEDDSHELETYLLQSMVRVGNESYTIAECINKSSPKNEFYEVLGRYGIRADVGCYYIANTENRNIDDILSKTKWKNSWLKIMRRNKKSSNNDNKALRINGKPVKVRRFPFERWEI